VIDLSPGASAAAYPERVNFLTTEHAEHHGRVPCFPWLIFLFSWGFVVNIFNQDFPFGAHILQDWVQYPESTESSRFSVEFRVFRG
jgi:hypothetical protein